MTPHHTDHSCSLLFLNWIHSERSLQSAVDKVQSSWKSEC